MRRRIKRHLSYFEEKLPKLQKMNSKNKNNSKSKLIISLLMLFLLIGVSSIINYSKAKDSEKTSTSVSDSESKILVQADTSNQEIYSNSEIQTETIYIKNANNLSFNYDTTTVKEKDGKIQCIDDDRILQWHKGEKKWECRKPTHAVFGDLDDNSVNINSSGELECVNDGDFLYWDGGDDQWACGDVSGMNSITAGNGVSLEGSNLSINAPICSGTDKLQWNGTAFICASDVDTDTNTDSQTLAFNSGTGEISISSGNTVDLSSLSTGTADHNDLNSIQGGTIDEYYHLTAAQSSNLIGFSDALNLPTTDGTIDQVLKTYGAGTLSWTNNPSGVTDHTLLSNIGTNTHTQIDTHIADLITHFAEGDINHLNIQNVGTNDHATIDTHLASTLNPHTVTATQVGNTTAQWNANSIQNIIVDDTDIADGKILQYNLTSGNLEYETPTGGSSTFTSLTDTMGSFTAGSILFTSSSVVTEDNSNLFYDDATDSLGIGQNSPTAKTHIKGTASDDTAYALKVDDSSDANLFSVKK
ncbi:MAG: hypothetical protein KAT32_03220 [Candidatus Moranbacteria bacterium]|nr:hypothetical protein [Candidatus Moranbacteria bacterium]